MYVFMYNIKLLYNMVGCLHVQQHTITIIFNVYLENIMRETLHNFHNTVSVGGRPINGDLIMV